MYLNLSPAVDCGVAVGIKTSCSMCCEGVDVCTAKDLSVLDLAPGGTVIRLTVFSKKAIEEISQIKSTHLELMVTLQ